MSCFLEIDRVGGDHGLSSCSPGRKGTAGREVGERFCPRPCRPRRRGGGHRAGVRATAAAMRCCSGRNSKLRAAAMPPPGANISLTRPTRPRSSGSKSSRRAIMGSRKWEVGRRTVGYSACRAKPSVILSGVQRRPQGPPPSTRKARSGRRVPSRPAVRLPHSLPTTTPWITRSCAG